jgi:phospholipid/cholesterol/gamma-HCH transport system substrate-binding protein
LSAAIIEREPVIGALVLAVGIAIMALAYASNGQRTMNGYDLEAQFAKAEGIGVGADVRLAGVDIGKVIGQRLDDRFQAHLTLRIAPSVKLPKDTAALIQTDGLLGAKFIALQPGSDDADLKPGDHFQFTQSSMNLNDILELIISQAQASRAAKPAPDKLDPAPAPAKPAD